MTFPSAFAASAAAIFIERPARRTILAVYVANEATQERQLIYQFCYHKKLYKAGRLTGLEVLLRILAYYETTERWWGA